MKKILVILLLSGLAYTLSFSFGQTAKSSKNIQTEESDDASSVSQNQVIDPQNDPALTAFFHRGTIVPPQEAIELMYQSRIDEAIKKIEEYKASLSKNKDDLQILLMEAEFYSRFNPYPEIAKREKAIMNKLRSSYGNKAEVIRFDLDALRRNPAKYDTKKAIEVASKMIEADSDYLPGYYERGMEYLRAGMIKEYCEDFSKLPEAFTENNSVFAECENLEE